MLAYKAPVCQKTSEALSALPCHPLVSILSPNLMITFVRFRTFLHVETQQFMFSYQSNHRQ